MSWVKNEAKGFTKEFARQGTHLIFGVRPRNKSYNNTKRKTPGAVHAYHKAQGWARRNGYKK
jgi:hypothetical protein